MIRFRRNFGQTAAFAAGFAHARGRVIVTSDGDLQNDPRDIPAMVEHARTRPRHRLRLAEGSEGRVPLAAAAVDDGELADLAVTGVHLHDYGCSLKVFRAEVVKPLKLYGEMHRFLPAIASEQGVDASRSWSSTIARASTATRNTASRRTIRVILDLLTVKFLLSYSTRPLQIFGLIGIAMGLAGAADHRRGWRTAAVRDSQSLDQLCRCCCSASC